MPDSSTGGLVLYDLKAVSPKYGKLKTVQILKDDLEATLKHAPRSKVYQLVGDRADGKVGCVQHTLVNPLAIFGGVREMQEEGRCYVGRPPYDFDENGQLVAPPPKMVFLVFLTPKSRVFDWRWCPADNEYTDWPIDYNLRFKDGKIWPN